MELIHCHFAAPCMLMKALQNFNNECMLAQTVMTSSTTSSEVNAYNINVEGKRHSENCIIYSSRPNLPWLPTPLSNTHQMLYFAQTTTADWHQLSRSRGLVKRGCSKPVCKEHVPFVVASTLGRSGGLRTACAVLVLILKAFRCGRPRAPLVGSTPTRTRGWAVHCPTASAPGQRLHHDTTSIKQKTESASLSE